MRQHISIFLLLICALETVFWLTVVAEGANTDDLSDRWASQIHTPSETGEKQLPEHVALTPEEAKCSGAEDSESCRASPDTAVPKRPTHVDSTRQRARSESLESDDSPPQKSPTGGKDSSLLATLDAALPSNSIYFEGMPFIVDLAILSLLMALCHFATVRLCFAVLPGQGTLLSVLTDAAVLATLAATSRHLFRCTQADNCDAHAAVATAACLVAAGLSTFVRGPSDVLRALRLTKQQEHPFPPRMSRPLPVAGHLLEFIRGPLDLVKRGLQDHGPVFSCMLGPQRMTFLIGPEESAVFYRGKDDEMDQAEVYKFMIPIFGQNVLYDSPVGERREQMKMMSQGLLGTRHLRTYVKQIQKEVALYCDKHLAGEQGELDLKDAMAELTILTASRALLGEDVREHCYEEMASSYHTLDKGLTPLSVIFPHAPIAAHTARNKARKAISQLFSNVIAERRAGDTEHTDLLQTLMDAKYKAGHGNSDDQITGILIGTLFAGHHTSSSGIAWAMMLCSKHPEVLGRLLEELPEGWDGDSELSFEQVKEMPFMHAVIKETLRMYPPLILLMRKAQIDHEVNTQNGAYTIARGDIVCTSTAVSGRLGHVFPDPDRFDPDRFMPPRNEDKERSYAYPPFGGGIHGCMGQQYGFLQLKVILATMIRKYQFQVDAIPLPDYEAMVVGPKGKCTTPYKRRSIDSIAVDIEAGKKAAEQASIASINTAQAAAFVAGSKAALKKFSAEEVAKHNKRDDAWIIVDGKVYDVTSYVDAHPGGDAILENVGYDSSEGFNGPQHPPTVKDALDTYKIGELE